MRFYILLGGILSFVLSISSAGATSPGEFQKAPSCQAFSLELQKFLENLPPPSTFSPQYLDTVMTTAPVPNLAKGAQAESLKAPSAPSGGRGDSQTNVQVVGVDEADSVKQDATFLYTYNEATQSIYRFKKGATLQLFETIKLPENLSQIQLYLDAGKLVVVASKYVAASGATPYWYPTEQKSHVRVYELTNSGFSNLQRVFEIDGNPLESRLTGGNLYLLSQSQPQFPVMYWNGGAFQKQEFKNNFTTDKILPKQFEIRRVTSMKKANYRVGGKLQPYAVRRGISQGCAGIQYAFPDTQLVKQYHSDMDTLLQMKTLSVVPLADNQAVTQSQIFFGDIQSIYMSQKSLYIASSVYEPSITSKCPPNARCAMPMIWNGGGSTSTRLTKYTLQSGGGLVPVASAKVAGVPLNQYSMDEYNDSFRIVTQVNRWGEVSQRSTSVTVFDAKLQSTGQLNSIAPGETFQSSRFTQNKLYLVTFKQVDPFFTIDLSDVKNPKILGELKIPGYSTYLHPYDAQRLIGIGYDTTENAWGGTQNGGIKIDLYNVEDLKNPKQEQTLTLGSIGSSSEVLHNPRLFVWDAQENILYLIADIRSKSRNPEDIYASSDAYQGIIALRITPNEIRQVGSITHMNVDDATLEKERSKKCQTYAQPQEVSCKKLIGGGTYCPSSNTWVPPYCYADSPIGEFRVEYLTQSWKSRIERVLYSGDALYAISNSKLTQHIRSSPYTQTSQYIFEQNDQ